MTVSVRLVTGDRVTFDGAEWGVDAAVLQIVHGAMRTTFPLTSVVSFTTPVAPTVPLSGDAVGPPFPEHEPVAAGDDNTQAPKQAPRTVWVIVSGGTVLAAYRSLDVAESRAAGLSRGVVLRYVLDGLTTP